MADVKNNIKSKREPLIHIAKRDDMVWWKAWIIRGIAILTSIIIMMAIALVLANVSRPEYASVSVIVETMYRGVLGRIEEGSFVMLWKYLQEVAILLCLALALTPAFKMKFWNCGAEGQALIGGFGAVVCMIELGGKVPDALLIPIIIVVSILCGAIWGFIPAIFKAFFNTNETLFTLMMNYIATKIIAYYVYIEGGGSHVIAPQKHGNLPNLLNNDYLLNIVIVALLTVVMFVYLKYSKHGYEINVVGESQNTARYIGINVKKVIIRTMCISGALCGVGGMLLVAGTDHTIRTDSIGGQGFTAIMISWLGQFNPFIMVIMTGLVKFLEMGMGKVADNCHLNSSFADIVVGIVLLCVVGCEFFVRYSVKFRRNKKEVKA
ncbi:MAG: ABC transporter permease [Clostridia bacterium]|nr:ABC transporter permease [Clostridia bacterium]